LNLDEKAKKKGAKTANNCAMTTNTLLTLDPTRHLDLGTLLRFVIDLKGYRRRILLRTLSFQNSRTEVLFQ
jgi:hypothetical protein